MKKGLVLFCVCTLILAVTIISCSESQPEQKPVQYPDSVYGKARFGKDKFN